MSSFGLEHFVSTYRIAETHSRENKEQSSRGIFSDETMMVYIVELGQQLSPLNKCDLNTYENHLLKFLKCFVVYRHLVSMSRC